jgi:phosphoenolpyruvate synthase/pyruvate phosphate dikinase
MQYLAQAYESIESSIPLTFFIPIREVETSRLSGFAASPGMIEAPCAIIRDLKDLQKLPLGAIAVCEAALPALMPFMTYLGGLVTERGGGLSIVAQYAREYGIPAVFGVEGLMDAIREGDVIRVDGSSGSVDMVG